MKRSVPTAFSAVAELAVMVTELEVELHDEKSVCDRVTMDCREGVRLRATAPALGLHARESMPSRFKSNIFLFVLLVAIVFEAGSALELILAPSAQTVTPGFFVGLFMAVFGWLIPLSPFLLLALLYIPLIRAVVFRASLRSKSIKHLTEQLSSLKKIFRKDLVTSPSQEKLGLLEHHRIILIVSMIIATLLAYFPYRSDVNPQQIPVGVDALHYIREINQMLNKPFPVAANYALNLAWSGSRPLFLLAVYFVAQLGHISVDVVIKLLPAFLAPLLVISSYYLVSVATTSKEDASITALLTSFSPVLTVGIWAGYYPNWLAIIETFALLGVLLSHLRTPSTPKLVAIIGLSLVLVLTHLWTWLFVIAVTTIFLSSLRREIPSRVLLKVGGSILLTYPIAELLKTGFLVGQRVVETGELVAGQVTNPFANVIAFFPNLVYGLVFTYDGLLANSVLLALATISVITLRYGDRFERLMLCWVALTALSFLFFGDLLQSRLVYNLPLVIIASSGLLRITLNAPFKEIDKFLIILLVILYNANYALLAMTRLPLL